MPTADAPHAATTRFHALTIAGLALMMAATVPIALISTEVDHLVWPQAEPSELISLALSYLAAANAFAIGLIALLAGLGRCDPFGDSQARKGALARLLGANLLIVAIAFTELEDHHAFDPFMESWLILPAMVAFLVVARAGIVWFRHGWRYEAVDAERLLQEDGRAPVVYIRSFKSDDRIASRFVWTAAFSIEQELAAIMSRVGPVVAIGRPGEPLPQLGAARLYVGDDEWRGTITNLMRRARLVVVLTGGTANLKWEIDQAAALLSRQRLIFVVPPTSDAKAFERDIAQRFGEPELLPPEPRSTLLQWVARLFNPYVQGKIIYFGADGRPCAALMPYALSPESLFLAPYRPYRDTLNAACRRVFKELGLAWTDRRSRTVAVLLAFFGGAFGLHQFYLGDKRRGMRSVKLFWTCVPLFLGWIDAFKLATTDDRAFAAALEQNAPGEAG